jgi:HEAT repeat protein
MPAVTLAIVFVLPAADSERDKENTRLARQLVAILRDAKETTQARTAAANTLGKMGMDARSIVPELIHILNDTRRAYPFALDDALVRAMGKIGLPARPAIPALVRNKGMDHDLDRQIHDTVVQILDAVHLSEDVAALVHLLKSTDVGERLRAAKKLAAFGVAARGAIPALNQALNDPDRDVSRQALHALQAIRPGLIPDKATLGVYIRDLTDADESIRLRAAKSLGKFGAAARAAVPALQAVTRNDTDEDVRRVAGDAITRIQGP